MRPSLDAKKRWESSGPMGMGLCRAVCSPLFGPFVSILGISENHQKTLVRRRDPPGDMEKQRFPQKLVFLEITKNVFF